MAKHHIVQRSYLEQWLPSAASKFPIYVIPDNEFVPAGPYSKRFWRKDFNILMEDGETSYFPEDVTAIIDSKGIDAIRRIDAARQDQLSPEDRSAVAFYAALQFRRTPRFREETDKLLHAQIQWRMSMDLTSPDRVKLSKKRILAEIENDQNKKGIFEKISQMSEREIHQSVFDLVHQNKFSTRLSKTGHSKSILKVDRLAKQLFDMQWLFLIAPAGSSFVTSDNPCFTISASKMMNGPLSPHASTIFPLRPDLCLYMKKLNAPSHTEHYMSIDAEDVLDLNRFVLRNSYECVVGSTLEQLQIITRDFDYKAHRRSRDIVVSSNGPYTMFTLQ